ncbi:MAG: phosphatidylserine decarboxylase family protein [Rhodothermales bacterium]|nr:phosphatidylserine decarboxylase family protein [Rhodothermales bacterium]
MIAREGYLIVAVAAVLGAALVVVGFQLPAGWRWVLFVLAALVLAFTLYFFRDPRRTPPREAANLVLSPADGKVVLIEEVHEPLYLKGPARQLSIFLSPLNVHVNRIPADGVIEYDEYVPGEYLVAWHEKASEKNERSQLGLRHPYGMKILFKQIAGAVARRIVYHVRVGDEVRAGDRFGIVKFGSRMDVLVPPEVTFDVAVGDRVTAGVTVLAHLPRTDAGAAAPQHALTHDEPA